MMSIRPSLIACTLVAISTACHRQASPDEHSGHAARMGRGTAGLPPSNGAAAARLAASPRKGEWIKVAYAPGSKDTAMAWVVYPSNARTKAPVVIVVHDIGGHSTWARSMADQAAAEGFIGVSPDF